MEYRQRFKFALFCSVVFHVMLLWALPSFTTLPTGPLSFAPEPIVIDLVPEKSSAEPMQSLIDGGIPADKPAGETDLIADTDTQASGLTDGTGSRNAPAFDAPSAYDQVGKPAAPSLEPSPLVKPTKPQTKKSEPESNKAAQTNQDPIQLASLDQKPSEDTEREEPSESSSTIPPPSPTPKPGETKGRPDGGAKGKGVVSFEAKRHEMAPYLREVRDRVEARWQALLQLRYKGATPTEAVVDCAINPNGEVVYANILEPGERIGFAPLCKEAIETAGPFRPFPFDVPEAYRTKNIEIRWTFSFM